METSPSGLVGSAPISMHAPGSPVTFASGQFAGQNIRAELLELQAAKIGRKFAHKDRRPLDPPPIAQLKLFRVLDQGGMRHEREIVEGYDEADGEIIRAEGLICHIDLFPVELKQPPSSSSRPNSANAAGGTSNTTSPPSTQPASPASSASSNQSETSSTEYTRDARPSGLKRRRLSIRNSPEPRQSSPGGERAPSPEGSNRAPQWSGDSLEPNDYAVLTDTVRTTELAGQTFTTALKIDYQGAKALMFPFPDIACSAEGLFALRYRIFDVCSLAQGPAPIPVLAECVGKPFRVYSTKTFPGLQASTALTKLVAVFGIKTSVREDERRRGRRTMKDR